MGVELKIFVGGSDSSALAKMEELSRAQGFECCGGSIVAALENIPDSVVIRGGLTEYCVADTARIALHFGVPEVIIDLRHCRATIQDKGDDENIQLRRETLKRGLGRRVARDSRLNILPPERQ